MELLWLILREDLHLSLHLILEQSVQKCGLRLRGGRTEAQFRRDSLLLDQRCAINSLIERYLSLVLDGGSLALRMSARSASQTTNAIGESYQLLDGQLRGLNLDLLLEFVGEQCVFLDLLVEHHRNLVYLNR